jgi:hypothetical protein
MYKLLYGKETGQVYGIELEGVGQIPLCEANLDYQEFLKWNSEQAVPLDLNSTIEVVKSVPARDLAKEITDLKAIVTANTAKIATIEGKTVIK